MTQQLNIPSTGDRSVIYGSILPQIRSLLSGEPDLIANMANVTSVLNQAFDFLWTGFYLVRDNELVLGPFQGPVACTRIAYNKGVCGTSWAGKKIIIVPDVDKFPGHIACSADSRSEIVIPGIKHEKVYFILDIDSTEIGSFNETDAHYLEQIVSAILEHSEI